MSYTFDHIESLIVRSLEGDLSPAEQEELQSWLEEDDANRRYYGELQRTWDLTATADADIAPDVEANWASFNSKLQASSQPTGIVRSFRWYALRAAAAVLLLGGAATAWYMLNAPRQITIQTAANETNIIALPDGTKAFINKNSSLRYASNFNKGERAIHLEGEAYFDVVKDDAHPFVVYTSRTRTQVLGTTFDVKAYAVQPVEVFVLSGKVAVSDQEKDSKEVVLTEGRKVTLGKDQQLAEDAISNHDFIAWKDNIMVFNDEPIRNVIRKAEALYGVKIVADESVANYNLKTRITPDEPLEQVLDVIAASANASWEKEGDVYKLNRK
ncbi:FecR family protein [Chitinophaga filiformis]|uniref:Ferric-dicitrate binding protein FerR, regulates iron transport through sigma-19 n=1 Tax=Chitinophaga filiformis TaxID=104663 RepID=A0A1G7U8A6_CHIFI|nr:FecR family protein [Chitinophaga filiformis]SDG43541.1 ferric-dicitrate binding protein FerR, regulates iron transport through sigma-19 [Chitinophaga filiformis]